MTETQSTLQPLEDEPVFSARELASRVEQILRRKARRKLEKQALAELAGDTKRGKPTVSAPRQRLLAIAAKITGLNEELQPDQAKWWEEQRPRWAADPWAFFTAKDPDGRPLIWTKDQRDKTTPLKPFPAHLTYLREILATFEAEGFNVVEKARQMYLSTLAMLYVYWDVLFREHREWLISKTKEAEAVKLMNDKIRLTHRLTPPGFRALFPMRDKPAKLIRTASQSEVLAVAANMAVGEARGRTASGIVIDEAAYQPGLEEMITAVLSMADKVLMISTPAAGDGAACMASYIQDNDDPARPAREPLPGLRIRHTVRNAAVISVEYWANETKTQEWATEERRLYGSEVQWRREMGLDWTAAAGKPFYPEFAERPEFFIHRFEGGLAKECAVVRGWDFGFHAPACVWYQYHATADRCWIIRELTPRDIDTYSFARLVLYLSGQLPFEALAPYPRALLALRKIEGDPRIPAAPWFGPGVRFDDRGGHEMYKRSPHVDPRTGETSDYEILSGLGIRITMSDMSIGVRENVIRRMMLARADGLPGLLIDPACPELIAGFGGGLAYPKPTAQQRNPYQVMRDGRFENPHDAFSYGIVADSPVSDMAAVAGAQRLDYYEARRA
jgi:hypothetical protein